MATIHFVSPVDTFGRWGPHSPDDPGIGGSETMHCEMAWHLAARGHVVHSYVPLLPKAPQRYRSVQWHDLSEIDYAASGLWILIRGIQLLDKFPDAPHQRRWCVFQDVDAFGEWQSSWTQLADRIIALCPTHAAYLQEKHPDTADKVCLSRNGIRGDLVLRCSIDSSLPPRNPHRLTYASSPDRGLLGLLQAFRLIRFLVPDAELHVCYGFDNIDKLKPNASRRWQRDQLLRALDQPGVIVRGRMGQPQLYREWLQTGIMCAPTNFSETGYITLMEAQALGAIPIVNPIWAAKAYQIAGIAIPGDAERDALTIRRYAMAAVHLMQHPEGQEEIRGPMMEAARKQFDWADVVDQYEAWMQEDGLG